MDPLDICIIGGGPGGLMTAYLLEKRRKHPCNITLYEASGRVGGKILTTQFAKAGVTYEAGAAELYDYSQLGPDPLREMVAELGLSTSPMWGDAVVMDDHILSNHHSIAKVYGKEAWQALEKFTRRARAHISPADYYESDWRADNADPMSRRSLSALLAKVSDDNVRRYILTAIHSDLATEPHQTNVNYGLQNYLMNERDYMRLYTIDGGIEKLPAELARRITAKIMLNHAVVSVERTPEKAYRVGVRHRGEESSAVFDYVVVALPNNWIPAIDWRGQSLARAMRRHYSFYDHPAHYLRVSILFEKQFWREFINESYFMIDAFGGCCVYDESSRNCGGPYGVLGWLLAGEAALNMSNFDDDTLINMVLNSLPTCMKHGRQLMLEGRVHRWVGSVNALPGGLPLREPDSRHSPDPVEHPEVLVVGDYLFDSTINGVLDSADVVVEWILEDVQEMSNPSGNGVLQPGQATTHESEAALDQVPPTKPADGPVSPA